MMNEQSAHRSPLKRLWFPALVSLCLTFAFMLLWYFDKASNDASRYYTKENEEMNEAARLSEYRNALLLGGTTSARGYLERPKI